MSFDVQREGKELLIRAADWLESHRWIQFKGGLTEAGKSLGLLQLEDRDDVVACCAAGALSLCSQGSYEEKVRSYDAAGERMRMVAE